jgi:hypothetical protein
MCSETLTLAPLNAAAGAGFGELCAEDFMLCAEVFILTNSLCLIAFRPEPGRLASEMLAAAGRCK